MVGLLLTLLVGSRVAVGMVAGEASLEGKRFSVEARVEYSQGGAVEAKRSPAEFKIPEGYQAVQLRYRWADPKTGRERDRITATTVYSITQGRYMSELKDNPNAVLPPGRYKLVVGGLPGAIGTLTYRLMPQTDPAGPQVQAGDRIIRWKPG